MNDQNLKKQLNPTIENQLLKGLYTEEDERLRVIEAFHDPQAQNLAEKILTQDMNLLFKANQNYETNIEINENFNSELASLSMALNRIKVVPQRGDPVIEGMEKRVREFENVIMLNNDANTKSQTEITKYHKKIKEDKEFLDKFVGEKRTNLNKLDEKELTKETHGSGFKYFFEAKIFKLIFEGVLLMKVQDAIDKELIRRAGDLYQWNAMDYELHEKLRLERDLANMQKLNVIIDPVQRKNEEKRMKAEAEIEAANLESRREQIMTLWKQVWAEIWIPGYPLREENRPYRELMIDVTLDVTYDFFKKCCYNAWKFKNIFLACEEYVVLEETKRYFPNEYQKDESILSKIMHMVDSIKREQNILYCDTKNAWKKIKETEHQDVHREDLIEFKKILEEIDALQKEAKSNSKLKFVSDRTEELYNRIKSLKDDHLSKLLIGSFKDDKRFDLVQYPATATLIVVLGITIANKRLSNYHDSVTKLKAAVKSNTELSKELEGKIKLITEMKEHFAKEKLTAPESHNAESDNEYKKSLSSLSDAKKTYSSLVDLKNKLEQNYISFIKTINQVLVKPKDLK